MPGIFTRALARALDGAEPLAKATSEQDALERINAVVRGHHARYITDLTRLAIPGLTLTGDPFAMVAMIGASLATATPEQVSERRRWSLREWGEHLSAEPGRRERDAGRMPRSMPRTTPAMPAPAPSDGTGRGAPPDRGAGGAGRGAGGAPPGGRGGPPEWNPPIPGPPAHLTPTEREAYVQAYTRAGEYARGMGNVVSEDCETLVREAWDGEEITLTADERLRLETRATVREETARALGDRVTSDELARRLGRKTGDWARNWRRIAVTELQGARNDAVAIRSVRVDGDEARVARIPEPNACAACKRLFLEGGRPRIFTVAELVENGTNVGRRGDELRPTLWPVHPYCRCDTQRIPPGFTLDEEWTLAPE